MMTGGKRSGPRQCQGPGRLPPNSGPRPFSIGLALELRQGSQKGPRSLCHHYLQAADPRLEALPHWLRRGCRDGAVTRPCGRTDGAGLAGAGQLAG